MTPNATAAADMAAQARRMLDNARDALRQGKTRAARHMIVLARRAWAAARQLGLAVSVAARRTAGETGAPRWRPVIHVKGGEPLTLIVSLRTYAHRQSADRAAAKSLARLEA